MSAPGLPSCGWSRSALTFWSPCTSDAAGRHLLPVPRCPGWRLPECDAGQEPAFGPSGVLATSLPAVSLTPAFILTPFSLPLALPSFSR